MENICLISTVSSETGVGRYTHELFSELNNADLLICEYPDSNIDISTGFGKKIPVGANLPLFQITLNNIFDLGAKDLPEDYKTYHIDYHELGGWLRHIDGNKVITVHDLLKLDFNYGKFPRYERLLFKIRLKLIEKYADKVISISEATKKDLLSRTDIPEDKIEVIHYGLDHEKFEPRDRKEVRNNLGLPLDKKIILNVGNFIHSRKRKNLSGILEVAKKVNKKTEEEILLLIAGPYDEQTSKQIQKISNLDIKTAGLVDQAKIANYYNAADVLLFPSYAEGFGLPPLEAMGCGLPVVTSNKTSIPEVVGDAGLKFDPDDHNSMAKEIVDLLEDKKYRKKKSKESLERSKKFTWEKAARKTEEVYRKLNENSNSD